MYSRIIGTGRCLPEKILTNQDLEKIVDTTDEWIRTRTGIEERRIGGTTIGLSVESGRQALEMAGLDPSRIDALVLATTTPDQQWGNAPAIQHELGLRCGAMDVNAACSGFMHALSIADKFIRCGDAKCVLVIGAEIITKLIDWDDRSTCVLFGDGAGAVIVQAAEEPGILSTHLGADGQYRELLHYPFGVSHHLELAGTDAGRIMMKGNEVFKVAVTTLGNVASETLEKAGIDKEELDWLIPHQANIRIIQATAKRLGLPMEKVILTVQDHGNTSAASVPMALDVGRRDGRVKEGQMVLMEAFGGGFTWGSVLMRL